MKNSVRSNLIIEDDGFSGLVEFLLKFQSKKRASTIRMLTTLGYLFAQGRLNITNNSPLNHEANDTSSAISELETSTIKTLRSIEPK